MTKRSRESGLTLLEVLVALVLLSAIGLLMTDGLRFGARAWEVSRTQALPTQDLAVLRDFLREQYAGATARAPRGQMQAPPPVFEGLSDHLMFVAPSPQMMAAFGLARYAITLSPGERGTRDLILTVEPEGTGYEAVAPAAFQRQAVLASDVDRLELAFFGIGEGETDPRWHDRWEVERRLPGMIRLRLTFPPGDDRHWPDLYLPHRVGPVAESAEAG